MVDNEPVTYESINPATSDIVLSFLRK